MKLKYEGFNASAGDPLPLDRLQRMASEGANIIRTWIGNEQNRELIKYQISLEPRLQPLYIILKDPIGEINAVPDNSFICLGNEPNLGRDLPKMTPKEYADFYSPAYYIAREKNLRCYVGELSSISIESIDWLEELLRIWPDATHVGQHRYPYKNDQNSMRSPYGNRTVEMEDFYSAVEDRNVLITECGNKTISYWDFKYPFKHNVSQQERARLAIEDRNFWHGETNLDGIIWYQEWTGNPITDSNGNYGMYGPDFQRYPILNVFKD